MVQRIAALAAAATLLVAVDSFSPSASSRGVQLQGVCRQQSPSATTALQMAQKMTPTRKTRREDSFDREVPKEEEDEEVILDFSEAQSKLKEDENKRRVEEGLTVGLTKEVSLRPFEVALVCHLGSQASDSAPLQNTSRDSNFNLDCDGTRADGTTKLSIDTEIRGTVI